MGWLSKLFNLDLAQTRPSNAESGGSGQGGAGSKNDAYKRLKLVLMHDRTQISPDVLSKMRDELVQVISKYVDIDRDALELNLETESNTIALVANIPVMRMKAPTNEAPTSKDDLTTEEKKPAPLTEGPSSASDSGPDAPKSNPFAATPAKDTNPATKPSPAATTTPSPSTSPTTGAGEKSLSLNPAAPKPTPTVNGPKVPVGSA
ncbi:MAG: cell division topological specificity factor MinE [Vampirovibrionales bacterium]